ncbi:ABC transporter substrate-binding protein [Calderihabitans maritimus]|uniref:Oligopeptide/dipeptide ABC transporter peptide-binding protein n=1 Tax=Calderihabitans maritimus TaxID=1246530 RepID=A0A1Z5HQF2_9FIRM|nr:ABC transporter substrate-binding protein [Calderihabitans maritimus]GAW91597.1 oligopeptide/dipeptide ABC transporter peptide-binding protein [Calderihabitans maritimus]
MKKIAWIVVVMLVLSLVLAGCGTSEKSAVNNESGDKQSEASAEKVFVFGRGGDSVGLDPANVTDGESIYVTQQIYDTLVKYDKESTKVVPGLAEEWEVSKDGLEWTFKLRKGVKFHDGTPFNAEAVKFNFDRWMDENNPYHHGDFEYYMYMFGGFPGIISSVEVVDEYTVKIALEKPLAPFIQNLAMPAFAIASPEAIKKYGEDYFKHPVGTGPFKFVEWKKDDRIVLVKNEEYWGPEPKLDKVIFRTIPDNTARLMELEAGTIDAMIGVNPDDAARIKENPDLQLLLRPSMNVGYLAMNTEKTPFDNVLVRRAINHAINKEALIEAFYAGFAKPAKNPMPPSLWGYNDDIEDYEYDPAKAKALLAEAGYPDGFETTLWAMPVARPYMPQPMEIAQAIQQDLAAVGIKAEIVTYDWATYLEKGEKGEHDLYLLGWTGDNGDPDNFLYVLLDKNNAVKGAASNVAFYKNDKVHDLLVEAQMEMDQSKRAELYEEAQVYIHEDAPWVPLVHSTPVLAARKNVTGWVPHATGSESFIDIDIQ